MNTEETLPPRIQTLVERFQTIGEEQMRDLPLFNADLIVEAVGFELRDEGWVGILITPWFMNLMILPEEKEEWKPAELGKRLNVALPCGEVRCILGGDPEVGGYYSKSLHSPMKGFNDPGAARFSASEAMVKFLTPIEDPEAEAGAEDEKKADAEPDMGRRGFLRGKFKGSEA